MATENDHELGDRSSSTREDSAHQAIETIPLINTSVGPTNGSPIDSSDGDTPSKPPPPYRQSSFAQPRPNGIPRTPNRVRFDVHRASESTNGSAHQIWIEEEDPMSNGANDSRSSGSTEGQRLPLLTGIEAPSVTVAGWNGDFEAEDHLESARPKSGMKSAFMNMANSIMYGSFELKHTGSKQSR
ncbi:MAG: hypothetical protein M1831_003378 [Alyxoria varia]|nr:MAG: hypothetical protein M1831_003378 [Alyxoria varia]